MRPVIAILLGDPTGIGPEIVAKIFATGEIKAWCRPFIIGDGRILEMGKKIAEMDFPIAEIDDPSHADWDGPTPVIDLKHLDPAGITIGQISADAGRATGEMLVHAMRLCKSGQIAGFVFAPYHKAAMEYGGYPMLEKGAGLFSRCLDWHKPIGEMNVVGNLWTSRVTSHIPLKQVSENLSIGRITGAVRLAHATLQRAGFESPRLTVAGLNPHCGEDGLCGTEENEIIRPAVDEARSQGVNVCGPFSADTLFVDAVRGRFDGIITMYHDQGQIALKLMNFETAVTVLAGLPWAITTPAHGTAHDIAGKGIANPEAMRQAVVIASKIAGWRNVD
ncbi:MAG: 4-hydroxythreonine-4-phosphate dehydrogenase PdxA [Desulfobacteraceae bacterium]|nr:MAG: 4-hydroxythreonine-4-phosphate dehydrogenase PdxA [Desulfobacteraceae bacterium]